VWKTTQKTGTAVVLCLEVKQKEGLCIGMLLTLCSALFAPPPRAMPACLLVWLYARVHSAVKLFWRKLMCTSERAISRNFNMHKYYWPRILLPLPVCVSAVRRAWRELMYTAPGLGQYISGCIMFEDFLYSSTAAGEPM
jgi:hypothetical protein